ncbi:dnaJ homolog subfamily C member 17 [Chanos chanos]|uniref:DnaJ homolog subfamily C member 17 n=1 Tax=Chanos chanos TaxID=29144 RepID=A0A6J2W5X5_CHACN|nr:dnaJ homolog subfamily C member 17 [Chanos chanos]
MSSTKELLQMDLYALLGIEETASEKEIKKAYRQKALTCHPDKNPDNPQAAALFHQLSQALEVLSDAAARAAYNKIQAAKRQAEERTRRLDDKRKKIKLDLEAREKQAEVQNAEEVKVTRTLEEEIARIREEGSKQLLEEQKLIREQIQREREARLQTHSDTAAERKCNENVTPKLKLKWKSNKEDDSNGGYSEEFLLKLFQKYGDVLNVLVSKKKRGSAVVEFATFKAADLAYKNETGLTRNPVKISWLEGQQEATAQTTYCHNTNNTFAPSQSSLSSERDYESVVLMKMRQAAERQRLIEEMKREDEEAAES